MCAPSSSSCRRQARLGPLELTSLDASLTMLSTVLPVMMATPLSRGSAGSAAAGQAGGAGRSSGRVVERGDARRGRGLCVDCWGRTDAVLPNTQLATHTACRRCRHQAGREAGRPNTCATEHIEHLVQRPKHTFLGSFTHWLSLKLT
jgi:hypothetical protein